MNEVPAFIHFLFEGTAIGAVFLFYKASRNSAKSLLVLIVWMTIQGLIGQTGFYTITSSIPPRFILLLLPPLVCIAILFTTARGRHYLDRLDLKSLTILHTIRIPVELVLFLLCLNKQVPQLMTFEGRNFDILAGLSAPFIAYFGFRKQMPDKTLLLIWNFISLGLVLNIVINAVLSAPFPFQRFGFDQPDIALLYFPYVWLPCCIVPLVILSHLASIRLLLKYKG